MSNASGWEPKRLTELASYVNGFAFKPEDWGQEGLPIIRIEQLKNPEAHADYFAGRLPSSRIIEDGDLVFSWSASLFLRIWQHGRAALNQHLFKVVEFEGVDRRFLKTFIEFHLPALTAASHGSTMQHITRKELGRFAALFPMSELEQGKIAEILSTVDRAIEETEALIAKQERIKAGLMQDLLTRGIDDNNNLRPELIYLFKDSRMGRIPAEWDVRSFSECVTISKGQRDPKREPYRNWILVAPDHVESRTGLLLAKVSAFDQDATSGKYEFEPGDVVYSKIRPYLRKAILADFRGLCSADMYPLKPRHSITSDFLFMTILGERFSRYAESVSDRSGFPKINRMELADFQIAVPPLDEQKRIGDFCRKQRIFAIIQNRNLSKLRSLKSALMQDLLTGKKCVTPLLRVELNR